MGRLHRGSVTLALLAILVGAPARAPAAIGALDPVPSATILVPYFEVDLAAPASHTTVVALNNAGPAPALTNVTLWSDLGVPVFRFNLELSGFDAETFDVADLLAGVLPPAPGLPGCSQPPLSDDDIAALQAALTGQPSDLLGGDCAGRDLGDGLARGYLTIDTVSGCTDETPADAGYFAGTATDDNVLVADTFFVDAGAGISMGETAVHIEASAADPLTTTSGNYTFYGRFLGWSAADHREALPTSWEAGALEGASAFVVWRDPRVPVAAFDCDDGPPPPFPLDQESIVAWDTQENATDLGALAPFGAAVQVAALPITGKAGWVFLDLSVPGSTDGPPGDPTASQSYVLGLHQPERWPLFGAGLQAASFDNAQSAAHLGTPVLDASRPLAGKIGAPDTVPAATLLLPYFEVDLDDPNRSDTIVTLGAGTASPALANVVLWTDLGVPTLRFNVFLGGFDVTTIDLRLLFQGGVVERTATAACGPGDLPVAQLDAAQRDALRRAHTGRSSALLGGRCGGRALGDDIARGYMTVDVVGRCGPLLPGDPGYFGPGGVAGNASSLRGEYLFVLDREAGATFADNLVAIEASDSDPRTSTPGAYTFYRNFVDATAADNRERLAGAWQARYVTGGPAGAFPYGETQLLVWRDPGGKTAPFTCGRPLPAPFPLAQRAILAFDLDENVVAIGGAPFPAAAMRVPASDPALALPFQHGFLFLDLDDPAAPRQAHVTVVHASPSGSHAAGLGAYPVDAP